MQYGTEEYRDTVRDVLAMLEATLEIQGLKPDSGMDPRQNLVLLLENANSVNCLQIAMSVLASTWAVVCEMRADARGTTREQEMDEAIAAFRGLVS